jgi:hypothetical protein
MCVIGICELSIDGLLLESFMDAGQKRAEVRVSTSFLAAAANSGWLFHGLHDIM